MRIAMLSYPMLFQWPGGLGVQIQETIAALERRGINARLIDPVREKLTDFDLVHVFSAINGNHRIVEFSKGFGVPVVVSPLIRPHWTRSLGQLARCLESVVGRLTQWNVKTEYRQIAACLEGADALIALEQIEKRSIIDAFGIPSERVRVIPNGIPARFFSAKPQAFYERYGIEPGFILNVASVDFHKNQLAAAQALKGTQHRLVVIGPCLTTDRPYLESLTAFPHVTYLGPLNYDDPLLASAYAAAGAFCLTSNSEVMPLSVMEALAAGTPVVMTRHHCMNLNGMEGMVAEVEPKDETAIRKAVLRFLENPPRRDRCSESVRQFTWDAVAEQIQQCYEDVLAAHVASGPRRRKC